VEEKLGDRVAREKAAYDDGEVHKESRALQSRFLHVFTCPNSQRGESFLDQTIAMYPKDKDVLDYGCYDGWMTPRYCAIGPSQIWRLRM
jgi:hypothetical protein